LLHDFQLAFEAAIFLLDGRLVPTPWKSIASMFSQLLAPIMNGTVGDAQLSGQFGDRFAARLSQAHGFHLKFFRKGSLLFRHDPFPPLIISSIPSFLTGPERGKLNHSLGPWSFSALSSSR
jgi:hypothetical protein